MNFGAHFQQIEKLIADRGSLAELEKLLAQLKGEVLKLEREAKLDAEKVRSLASENTDLQTQLDAQPGDRFKMFRGLLWKSSGAGYEATPYCPQCKTPLRQFPPGVQLHWTCDQCKFIGDWTPPPAG